MQSLYSQLTKLLGKPSDDPDFVRVIEEIGEKPSVFTSDFLGTYKFSQAGVEISAIGDGVYTSKNVCSVVFFLDVPSVRQGFIERYCGQFMEGISGDDSMDEVRRKIELVPADLYAAHVKKLHYDFADHSVTFHFHEPEGKKMALVSVRGKKEI